MISPMNYWRPVRTSIAATFILLAAGCAGTPEPVRAPPPPTVTVFKAVKMNVPMLVSPNATTRA